MQITARKENKTHIIQKENHTASNIGNKMSKDVKKSSL